MNEAWRGAAAQFTSLSSFNQINFHICWFDGEERKSCAIHEINCFSFLFAGGYGRWHRQWLRQEEKTKEKQLMNEWSRSKERLVKSNNSTWMAVSMKLMKLIEWWWNELNWFDWTEGRGALAGRPRPFRSKSMKSKMNWIAEELWAGGQQQTNWFHQLTSNSSSSLHSISNEN